MTVGITLSSILQMAISVMDSSVTYVERFYRLVERLAAYYPDIHGSDEIPAEFEEEALAELRQD
jgi:hypothetical protein